MRRSECSRPPIVIGAMSSYRFSPVMQILTFCVLVSHSHVRVYESVDMTASRLSTFSVWLPFCSAKAKANGRHSHLVQSSRVKRMPVVNIINLAKNKMAKTIAMRTGRL
jgi:hypothetical protein